MRKFFLLLLFGASFSTVGAQDNYVLDEYSLYEVQGSVYVYWVLGPGSYCNGIGVERSVDSLFFTEIHDIAGVCGNVSTSQAFSFTDHDPIVNEKAYYRLRMGNAGYSPVKSILLITLGGGAYQFRPLPANEQTTFFFQNDANLPADFSIYNSCGGLMESHTIRGESFLLDTSVMTSGIYFFRLDDRKRILSGKFIVAH